MKGRAIVKTILTLGQNLGIEVVAEGIESQEQFTSLRNLGFSLGQGYYFSKPVNSELAERMLFENAESSLLHGLQDPGQIQDSAGIDAL